MKQILSLLLVVSFLISCKPTSSIITSKSEAQKRGLYKVPENNRISTRNDSSPKNNSTKTITKKAAIGTRINDKNADDYVITVDNSSYLVKQLINAAEENLGANYRSGGTTPEGFDCSGLMYSTFKKFDIILPRSSVDRAVIGE